MKLEKITKLTESKNNSKNIRDDYKKLTNTEIIDSNNLDNNTVKKLAARNYLEKDQVVEMLTESEETIGSEAEKLATQTDSEVVDEADDVKKELDRALSTNRLLQRRGKRDGYSNILLVGEAGVGKTARCIQWAKERGINLYIRNAMDLDVTDMGGAITPDKEGKKVNRLTTSEWDPLDRPNSVLFLDELNRADSAVRGQLLTLINNHTISDLHSESGRRFLPNLLFTIAAINPANSDYGVDNLDSAEYDRFKEVDIIANKRSLLNYLTKSFENDLKNLSDPEDIKIVKGQLALATTLLSDKSFAFDSVKQRADNQELGQNKHLSPRTFEAAINNSNGTKEDLLDVWSANCGATSKPMIERILKDYKDIDDKANDALASHESESDIFNKVDLAAKLRQRLASKK